MGAICKYEASFHFQGLICETDEALGTSQQGQTPRGGPKRNTGGVYVKSEKDRRAKFQKKIGPFLDLCVSSLRSGHANLLCIVPILTDVPDSLE